MKILGAHAENLGAHLKCPATQLVKLLAILTVLLINALVINEHVYMAYASYTNFFFVLV